MDQWSSALEGVEVTPGFWQGKRVLITGHTGFKGGWLALWLQSLGAEVVGYALQPSTEPSLFVLADVAAGMTSVIADIRDAARLTHEMRAFQPEIVFHLAAQPLVRYSYANPVETYATNVLGTVHLCDAVRHTPSVRAVVIVTSDKCYENREWLWGYREDEAMGGYDPYSNSKGCSELVASAYRRSYFATPEHPDRGPMLASARAGNVIGGGDWSADRLVPDVLRALERGESVSIRFPNAVRPWQHVLEPLSGYMLLAERLWSGGVSFAEGWNFGPDNRSEQNVAYVVGQLCSQWGNRASWSHTGGEQPHEASLLKLDSTKARTRLGWAPRWNIDEALAAVVQWHNAYRRGACLRSMVYEQIDAYVHGRATSALTADAQGISGVLS